MLTIDIHTDKGGPSLASSGTSTAFEYLDYLLRVEVVVCDDGSQWSNVWPLSHKHRAPRDCLVLHKEKLLKEAERQWLFIRAFVYHGGNKA